MLRHLRTQFILVISTILLCSVAYPLLLLVLAQGLLPEKANGSLVRDTHGNVIGSCLLAQASPGEEWFQPRPSAVDYNASGSGGSNLSANNPKLRERVETQLKSMNATGLVPADAVTASGSGLDPHITYSNARQQLDRVTRVWATKSRKPSDEVRQRIESLLTAHAFEPMWGITGSEPLINVLEINLALRQVFTSQP